MARPSKCRRICKMPENLEFSPKTGKQEVIIMTMDEYEVIRLMDDLSMTQEQCALQMNIARTTVTMIYENARRKMADMLVHGKRLRIEGGNIIVCENAQSCCGNCGKERRSSENCRACENSNCSRYV